MIRLSVTLADGTVHSADVSKMPRHWKSWLMQRAPYGLDYFGSAWQRERIS